MAPRKMALFQACSASPHSLVRSRYLGHNNPRAFSSVSRGRQVVYGRLRAVLSGERVLRAAGFNGSRGPLSACYRL